MERRVLLPLQSILEVDLVLSLGLTQLETSGSLEEVEPILLVPLVSMFNVLLLDFVDT